MAFRVLLYLHSGKDIIDKFIALTLFFRPYTTHSFSRRYHSLAGTTPNDTFLVHNEAGIIVHFGLKWLFLLDHDKERKPVLSRLAIVLLHSLFDIEPQLATDRIVAKRAMFLKNRIPGLKPGLPCIVLARQS